MQLPPNLFSHSDQQLQWQVGASDTPICLGWGGRLADQVASLNGIQSVATAVAVNGRSSFQQGAIVSPFQVASSGNFGCDSYDSTSKDALSVGFGEMINAPRSHLFEAHGMKPSSANHHATGVSEGAESDRTACHRLEQDVRGKRDS